MTGCFSTWSRAPGPAGPHFGHVPRVTVVLRSRPPHDARSRSRLLDRGCLGSHARKWAVAAPRPHGWSSAPESRPDRGSEDASLDTRSALWNTVIPSPECRLHSLEG